MIRNLVVTETKWQLLNAVGDAVVTGRWGRWGGDSVDLDNLDYDELTQRVARAAGLQLENPGTGSVYIDSIDGIQWAVIAS